MHLRPHLATTRAIPVLLLLACDPPKGHLGEYTDSNTTGGSESGSTDGTATTTDAGPDTSEGATTTSGGTLPNCAPPPAMTESFQLTFDPPLLEDAFEGECLVSDGENSQIFSCGEQQIDLKLILDHQPTPVFAAGNTVWFSYRGHMSFGLREWFAIRGDPGHLLLGGVSAETLVPPGEPEFFAPLTLAGVTGVCAPPVDCSNHFEQIEVAASLDGQTVQLGAGEFDRVGDVQYDVSVLTARKFHNDLPDGQGGSCSISDVPEFFYRVLLRRP